MRILFVLEHFHPYLGGVEFLFLHLAKELIRRGNEVEVITSKYDSSLPSHEIHQGISIRRINSKNRFTFTVLSIPTVISACKGADLIHTTTYNAALPAYMASIIKNKKIIITFHEYWGNLWEELPYLSFVQRKAYKLFENFIRVLRFDKIVAVSDFTKEALIQSGISEDRIVRIYNGLDYSEIDEIKSKIHITDHSTSNEVIFVGRLGISKGLDILIPAIDGILEAHKELSFKLVIPTIPEKLYKEILTEIDQLKHRTRLIIMHNLSRLDLYKEICKSRFVIIPSYSEGFGFLAAETEALGIPIISSHRGSLPEVVGNKHIRMQSHSSQGIIQAVDLAMKSNWKISKTNKFTLKNSVDGYIRLYKQLINVK